VKVLVDTSVWSYAFRRQRGGTESSDIADHLKRLIVSYRVTIIGPIRQELLSGIRTQEQYLALRDQLRAFPDLLLATEDYELAAQFFDLCRSRGIQGSNTDFLICAVASERKIPIFTTDRDFERYEAALPIQRYQHNA
jgi:predicted nucleic acid-binding protein